MVVCVVPLAAAFLVTSESMVWEMHLILKCYSPLLIAASRFVLSSEAKCDLSIPTLTAHVSSLPLPFPATDHQNCCLSPSPPSCRLRVYEITLYLIGRYDTPLCEARGVIEDVFHILQCCPLYATYRDDPDHSICGAGRRCTSVHHLLFPSGSPWLV